MLKKELNINKKIIITLLLVNIIIIGLGSSYAFFQVSVIQNNLVKLAIGNTDITTTIQNYSDNVVTFASGETKTLSITLSNPNTDYYILYKMYYTVQSGSGLLTIDSVSDNENDTMQGTKTLSVTLSNKNSSYLTVKIATKGGLLNSEIDLADTEYEIIKTNYICDSGATLSTCLLGSGVDGLNTSLEAGLYRFQGDSRRCSYADGAYFMGIEPNSTVCPDIYQALRTFSGGSTLTTYGTTCTASDTVTCTLLDPTIVEASNPVNNYVCFGASNKKKCLKYPDRYMYRIIGVTSDGKLKLMKNEALNIEIEWWKDYQADISWYNASDESQSSLLYQKLNDTSWNIYLDNQDYMPTAWIDKIVAVNWKYGDADLSGKTPAQVYALETAWTNETPLTKIGIIYASDYEYSLQSGGVACDLSSTGFEVCKTSWLNIANCDYERSTDSEYVMVRKGASGSTYYTWTILDSGKLSYSTINGQNPVRPVFFLTSTSKYISGLGTLTDPFIIS